MPKYAIYIFYNCVVIVIILLGMFILNSFINELLLPSSLKKSFEAEMITRFIIANIEGALCLLLIYFLNKQYSVNVLKKPNVAFTTFLISFLTILIISAFVCYQIYLHDK